MAYGLRSAAYAAAIGWAMLGVAALAASLPLSDGARGGPVTQRFLGGEASVIASPVGLACVAGAVIDVEASIYRESDGSLTPFEALTRSRAASLQFIAPADGGPVFARIQLKFSVGRGAATLSVGQGYAQDLRRFLEPSTDSFRIDDPETVAALRRAAEGREAATLATPSRDTGRMVIDTIPPMAFTAFDACRDALPGMPEPALPIPGGLLHIVYEAEPTPDTRATPAETRACGVVDPDVRLHRGRLRALSGFTTPDDRIFVSFDEHGAARRLHVPGLLDATRDGEEYAARLSVSADGNDPLAENAVTGCLGLAPTPLCDIDGAPHPAAFPLAQPEGVRSAGYCFGALTSAELLEEAVFGDSADPFDGFGARRGVARGLGALALPAVVGSVGAGLGGGGGGGGGGGFGAPSGDTTRIPPEDFPIIVPPPEDPPIIVPPPEGPIVIPAPPALWLLLGAGAALGALRLSRGVAARRP